MISGFFLSGGFNFSGIFLIEFLLFGCLEVISPYLELFGIVGFVFSFIFIQILSVFSFNLAFNIFLSGSLSESHRSNRSMKFSESHFSRGSSGIDSWNIIFLCRKRLNSRNSDVNGISGSFNTDIFFSSI